MDDEAPTRLKLDIAAFRAIAAAVTEAEIGGEVASVTITQLRPDLQLMAGRRRGRADDLGRRGRTATGSQTWIVAGDGRVVAHLEDPPAEPDQD